MASTYLSRTTSSPTLATKYTLSFWVKRSTPGADMRMFNNFVDANNSGQVYFNATDNLNLYDVQGGSSALQLVTNRKFRDVSAWYHIVIAVDTTQGTASDRAKIYVNGIQETSFSANNYPNQDSNLSMQAVSASGQRRVGSHNGGGDYFDGCLTHLHYVDGQAYAPTVFGETDSTSGIWEPKTAPSVTYGNNGEFLKFENSAAMGTDSSGNSNTYTVNGTMTQNNDTPSNVFACWNPQINNAEDGNWSNANLTIAPNGDASYMYAPITIPLAAGKWYSEHMISGGNGHGSIGFAGASKISDVFRNGNEPGNNANTFAFRCIGGGIKMADANTSYGSAPGTSNAILGIAVDITNQKFWVSVNGTYVTYGGGVGNPAAGTYGFDWSSLSDDLGWLMICGDSENNGYGNWKSNFGSGFFGTTAVSSANADANGFGAFEYAVPSGYYAICTKNVKEFG